MYEIKIQLITVADNAPYMGQIPFSALTPSYWCFLGSSSESIAYTWIPVPTPASGRTQNKIGSQKERQISVSIRSNINK
jgi:hypothetical protein